METTKTTYADTIEDAVLYDENDMTLVETTECTVPTLSKQELDRIENLTKSLSINDINSVSNYGSDLQNAMSTYSSNLLKTTKTNKSGEMGILISNLLSELNKVDTDDLKEKNSVVKFFRKIPIVKNIIGTVEATLAKYDTIESNVDKIATQIQTSRMISLRDNKTLEVMFENNKEYSLQIRELIHAGEYKLNLFNQEYAKMVKNSANYEPYQIQDAKDFIDAFQKRLNEMKILFEVAKQSLMQIRIVQKNNLTLADKASSIISNTIPVWKNQLTLSLALVSQREQANAIKRVSDATNEILLKNSELLKMNSIAVAKENERTVISIDTLEKTTVDLVETIKEIQAIHQETVNKKLEFDEKFANLDAEMDNIIVPKFICK